MIFLMLYLIIGLLFGFMFTFIMGAWSTDIDELIFGLAVSIGFGMMWVWTVPTLFVAITIPAIKKYFKNKSNQNSKDKNV